MSALTVFKALDQLDRPIAGAVMKVWPGGTAVKTALNYSTNVFSDAGLTTALDLPLVSDATGQFTTAYFAAGSYDLLLTDAQNRPLLEVNGATLT
jgi:hypothetical protein